ncbi:MAG: 30S ribosome-binding factor RbfA [Lachnospiraceae bacterium]|nr:30S ribosome-binding factor RbfA [Lachnospiraceae bacterium]
MKKGSMRSLRINTEVQRELGRLISMELKDPRVHPMTTVVSCEVTTDLKICKAYISVLADEKERKETMEGLKSAAPFLRRSLAQTINLRNTPELIFIEDQSIEHGISMSKLIDEVSAQDRKARELRGEEEEEQNE